MTTEQRHEPDVLKKYEGDGIEVHWEPKLCIHVTSCIRALPDVFDPDARPWIKIEAASADELAAAIESCPTGALSYMNRRGAAGDARVSDKGPAAAERAALCSRRRSDDRRRGQRHPDRHSRCVVPLRAIEQQALLRSKPPSDRLQGLAGNLHHPPTGVPSTVFIEVVF